MNVGKQNFYRAQPVGSLLRPDFLKEGRHKLAEGEITPRAYKELEDRAVDEAIALQERAGIDVATDGEQRRLSFHLGLLEALDGFEPTEEGLATEWYSLDGRVDHEREWFAVTDRVSRRRSSGAEEFTYLRSRTQKPVKITLPSPMALMYAWHPEKSREAYPDPFDFFADVAGLLRQDIEDLLSLGCEYIQIDAPEFTIMVDERRRAEWRNVGIEPERLVDEGVAHINALFEGLHAPPRVGLHMCRGNWDGRYMAEGGYEAIAKSVFRGAHVVDDFFLEYDDERSGSFEPLKDLPDDACVFLGLVSTKRNELEASDQVVARIGQAAEHFPRDQLGLCTQCGFASGFEGNPITPEVQFAKLELVANVAHRVWS